MSDIREVVRERYRAAALRMIDQGGDGGCGDGGCCGPTAYDPEELAGVGMDPSISLGCGNPLRLAELHPGETVLDLGSGGGLDVLLSARRVAPGGHVYGVDMTDEMLALAERNQARAGVDNVTFLEGTIEHVPLPDAAVDVVISNCVINLAADKSVVLREAFRVLRPGGRLAVSDVVALKPLPDAVSRDPEAMAGCIAGALPVADYRRLLSQAGFAAPTVEVLWEQAVAGIPAALGGAAVRATKPITV